jgi:TolA-binding protein
MNKKITLSIVLIAIIALALASWVVHNHVSALQNQISELQTQNRELQDQNTDLQEQNTDLQEQLSELQNQLSELQNKTGVAPDVKITAFKWLGGFNPIVGVTLSHPVNVTIQNTGSNDVSGLSLTVKLLYIDTQTEVGQGFAKQIDIIHAGEILEISGSIFATLGSFSKDSAECVMTLRCGDIVLDEWIRSLPTLY